LRDALLDYFVRPLGWGIGKAVNWVFDQTLKPHLDRVNGLIESFEDTWNVNVVARIRESIRDVQERLLNLLEGFGVTPLAVRNVSMTGCEVYAPANTDVLLIAAGA